MTGWLARARQREAERAAWRAARRARAAALPHAAAQAPAKAAAVGAEDLAPGGGGAGRRGMEGCELGGLPGGPAHRTTALGCGGGSGTWGRRGTRPRRSAAWGLVMVLAVAVPPCAVDGDLRSERYCFHVGDGVCDEVRGNPSALRGHSAGGPALGAWGGLWWWLTARWMCGVGGGDAAGAGNNLPLRGWR